MTNSRAESIAFREALLKSEHLRIRIVLGAIIAAFLLRTIRGTILGGGRENLVSWLMMLGLLSLFVTYEFAILRAVNRAIQRVRELANWIWLSNILLEALLPALAVAFLRSEEHTSELQSRLHLVCRLLLEKKKNCAITLLALIQTTPLQTVSAPTSSSRRT